MNMPELNHVVLVLDRKPLMLEENNDAISSSGSSDLEKRLNL